MNTRPLSPAHSWISWKRVTSYPRGASRFTWCLFDSTAPRRSRSGVRRIIPAPSIWVKFRGLSAAAKGMPRKIGSGRQRGHLDNNALDDPPQSRASLYFIRIFEYAVVDTEKGAPAAGCRSGRPRLQSECDIKENQGFARPSRGRDFEGMKFQASLPAHPSAGHSCRLCHARSGQRHRSHGTWAMAPTTLFPDRKYGLEIYAPLDDKGVYLEGLPEYKGKGRFFYFYR